MMFANATRSERIDKTLNVEQAEATRDALAKAIYFRCNFTSIFEILTIFDNVDNLDNFLIFYKF